MEQIKDLTKRLIANSFKELMLTMPFEKITIKVITDHANVIRPTFYNHFHDKYEMMEWILVDEVLSPALELLKEGKQLESIRHIFQCFYTDKAYYRRAFEVTGQNGFAETLAKRFPEMFLQAMENEEIYLPKENALLTKELMGQYYTSGMITLIRKELEAQEEVTVDELTEAYSYLATHTISGLIHKRK